MVVTAAALCHAGRLEIGFADGQVDAIALDRLTRMPLEELERVKHLAAPKELPIITLRDVATLLDIAPGAVPQSGANEQLVRQLLDKNQDYLDRLLEAEQTVTEGLLVWGAHVIDRQDERRGRLRDLRTVLEDVKGRDSVGRMNKLTVDKTALTAAVVGKAELERTEKLLKARNQLEAAQYVAEAATVFGDGDPLGEEAAELRVETLTIFTGEKLVPAEVTRARTALEQLKVKYQQLAEQAHVRDRLDAVGDRLKQDVLESDVFGDLDRLAGVELLPAGRFGSYRQRLAEIGTCKEFGSDSLSASVRCPHCDYVPHASEGPSARAKVEEISGQLRQLRTEWIAALRDSLKAEEVARNIALVPNGRDDLERFVATDDLPSPVTAAIVTAFNEVLRGFTVRNVTPGDLYRALFPEPTPATIAALEERFGAFIAQLQNGSDGGKVRVVPKEDA